MEVASPCGHDGGRAPRGHDGGFERLVAATEVARLVVDLHCGSRSSMLTEGLRRRSFAVQALGYSANGDNWAWVPRDSRSRQIAVRSLNAKDEDDEGEAVEFDHSARREERTKTLPAKEGCSGSHEEKKRSGDVSLTAAGSRSESDSITAASVAAMIRH